jgi:hypothetical protein
VADETVAFSSLGATFCSSVRDLLPFLAATHKDVHFKNLINLFFIWDARFKLKELIKDKQLIDNNLKNYEDRIIKPIGTE